MWWVRVIVLVCVGEGSEVDIDGCEGGVGEWERGWVEVGVWLGRWGLKCALGESEGLTK